MMKFACSQPWISVIKTNLKVRVRKKKRPDASIACAMSPRIGTNKMEVAPK
jgi:hypothetical protein